MTAAIDRTDAFEQSLDVVPDPPPTCRAIALSLLQAGVIEVRAGRMAAARVLFSRLLLVYPSGHGARALIASILDALPTAFTSRGGQQ